MVDNTAVAEKQLVVFNLGEESYAIDIVIVREIIQMQAITRVPGTSRSVEGVINLRGSVIPVVDLRLHFHLNKTIADKDTRIVVVSCKGQDVGVIVDSMSKVLRIPVDTIESADKLFTSENQEYLLGVAKLSDRLVILLDMEKVLSNQDITVVSASKLVKTEKDDSKKNHETRELAANKK